MTDALVLTLIVYVTAVLETVFADAWAIGPVGPDLLAVVAVVWLVLRDVRGAVYIASAIGLAADLVSPGPVGVGAASFALVAWCVVRVKARIRLGNVHWGSVTVWLSATVIAFLSAIAMIAAEGTAAWRPRLPLDCLAVGVYSAAVAIPVLIALVPWRRPQPYTPRGQTSRSQ